MPQNTCPVCLTELGADDRQTVACDSCRSRTHIQEKCSGLSTSESRAVVLQKRTLMYFCPDCREAFKSVPMMVRKMVKMEEDIQALQQKVLTLEREKSSEGTVSAESMVLEVSQRVARAQNLMIYRVPESDSLRLEERIDHDRTIVSEVFTKVGLQQDLPSIKRVVRVGKIKNNAKLRSRWSAVVPIQYDLQLNQQTSYRGQTIVSPQIKHQCSKRHTRKLNRSSKVESRLESRICA